MEGLRTLMGQTMGLFSFLFGGKKKEAAKPPAAGKPLAGKSAPTEKQVAAAAVKPVTVSAAPGIAQAKLRLKLAAALRSGAHAAAYEAALGLADIQVKAGRKTAARVWSAQADRIKASLAA